MFTDFDDLLTVEEMMEILSIGRNKAYELLQTNQVKWFKVGKAYSIPKTCIEEFVLAKVRMQNKYRQQNEN